MQNQVIMAALSHAKLGIVRAVITWSAIALLPLQSAGAVTLSNNDSKAYKIEIMVKKASQEHELAPGKKLIGVCKAGCVIRLNGSAADDYELEGTERVSIEGGLVYYDGEEIVKPGDATKSDVPVK